MTYNFPIRHTYSIGKIIDCWPSSTSSSENILVSFLKWSSAIYSLMYVLSRSECEYDIQVGMGIVENSRVRFGSRFCFYGSVSSRFPKRFINDISWIRNYAMECVAELA